MRLGETGVVGVVGASEGGGETADGLGERMEEEKEEGVESKEGEKETRDTKEGKGERSVGCFLAYLVKNCEEGEREKNT